MHVAQLSLAMALLSTACLVSKDVGQAPPVECTDSSISCLDLGVPCSRDTECCSGLCAMDPTIGAGACQEPSCPIDPDATFSDGSPPTDGALRDGSWLCRVAGVACRSWIDCCSGVCIRAPMSCEGTCGPPGNSCVRRDAGPG